MDNFLWQQLHKANNAFSNYLDHALKSLKITINQLSILETLEEEPIKLTAIGLKIGLDRTTVSRGVKRLIMHGFVDIVRSSDKRCSLCALSEKGKQTLINARKICETKHVEIEEFIQKHNLYALETNLEWLYEHIKLLS